MHSYSYDVVVFKCACGMSHMQWRKNKSENEVDNIFYEFTGQSATQVSSYAILVVDVY